MLPLDRDPAHLWDMLEAAREVSGFMESVRYDRYLTDKMLQRAVERCIEIIGEAARRVSEEFKGQHPEIPWRLIVGQRNVLAHEYGEVRSERMWAVATQHVPALVAKLVPLVPAAPTPSDTSLT